MKFLTFHNFFKRNQFNQGYNFNWQSYIYMTTLTIEKTKGVILFNDHSSSYMQSNANAIPLRKLYM